MSRFFQDATERPAIAARLVAIVGSPMKTLALTTMVLSIFVTCGAANAASCPPSKLVTTAGPTGKTLLCLDGKYVACLHDVQRLGWSPEFCQLVLRDEENSGARK